MRHKLKITDFTGFTHESGEIGKYLKNLDYDSKLDFQVREDKFEPLSVPQEDHIKLSDKIEVQFITHENDIPKLESLVGQKYVGVDAEWRPERPSWGYIAQGPSILQLGGLNESFVVDILRLKRNPKLDKMLVQIFSNPETTIIGFGFSSDLAYFAKYCKNMRFLQEIPNFLEL